MSLNTKFAVGLALICATAASQAAIFSYSLGTNTVTPTVTTIGVDTTGASGRIRAYYVTGDWTQVAGNPFSNEFRSQIVGVSNLGGGLLDRSHGGVATNAPFSFVAPSNTTANQGAAPSTFLANVAGADLGGTITVGLRQTFAGSSATMANATVHFATDIITPDAVVIDGTSPTMVARPNSLTTVTTGTYGYKATTFTAQASGAHHIGLYTGGVDGYVLLYNGAFDPNSPLTNLIGLDDVGDLTDTNSSSFWINLTGGQQYTMVSTTFTAGAAMGNGLATVAGPVPEPATMIALGAGVAALLRRRRKA